jgi:ferredoxin
MKKGEVKIDYEDKCYACGACVGLCPEEAITLVDKKTNKAIWANKGMAKTLTPHTTYVK